MAWDSIEAKCLRETSEKDMPEKPGIYKWWATKKALKEILKALELEKENDALSGIERKVEKDLYCIYVGQAKSLDARLKGNHVNGKGKSTFRNSVEAVVKKIYGEQDLEKRTNDFIDGLEIECRLVEHDKLDSEETKEIGGTYLRIFNQQHNGGNDLRKKYGITPKMTDLRGEI